MRHPTRRMRNLADKWLTDRVTIVDVTGSTVVDHDLVETTTEIWAGCALLRADTETTAVPDPGQKPVNDMKLFAAFDVTSPQVGHIVTVDSSEDPRLVGTSWTIEQVVMDGIITQRQWMLKAVTV